jgi:hypothetical protein
MFDTLGLAAVGLGLLAVAIAAWDHVRDDYYYRSAAGPVKVRFEIFDIPQPEVRQHSIGPRTAPIDVRGTQLRVVVSLRNRVSWPVYISFPIRHSLPPGGLRWMEVWDELLQPTGSSGFAPPRQPVQRTVWVTLAEGAEGTVTPEVFVKAGRDLVFRGPTARLTWPGGAPELEVQRQAEPQ